ncbi:MAG TPA: asparagine synthase (glutamine-hydrolyzing) [Flavobacteriales bacterium]|nr:asparagine synthase (glutamine-hydrolyzing) [Flavobacteriales bacterium]
MCGIFGVLSTTSLDAVELQRATKALGLLQHRGPDHCGNYHHNTIFLGHQRLSIIDCSPMANQPFVSACNNYVIVFNGEIYNYNALIQKFGLKTRTKSDTEVILELYIQHGKKVLEEIQGMFAFCIYDKRNNGLFIARDRLGIKPLYFAHMGNYFSFASEINPLVCFFPGIENEKNKTAITNFLHLGFIPAPHTLFKHIHKLQPGTWASVQNNHVETGIWFSVKETTPSTKHKAELGELKSILETAVEKQLIADVPVGCFLSGGIDSSLVTAIARKRAGKRLKTFTIGFEEAAKDESIYAQKIAKHLDTEHHSFVLNEKLALEICGQAIDAYGEPFADSSSIPTWLLSQVTSKHVKVALSGDGGDELFLGYGAYHWAKRLDNPFIKPSRKLISILLKQGNAKQKRAAELFNYKEKQHVRSHIFSQEQYLFSEYEVRDMCVHAEHNAIYEINNRVGKKGLNAIEQQQQFDLLYYLPDDLLTKIDRASMQHGLEVRVPLLDEEVFDYIIHIKTSSKLKGGELKYLLKKALGDYIPENLFNRPKQGFSIPLKKWLQQDLNYLINKFLSKQIIEQCGIIKPGETEKLLIRFNKYPDIYYNKVWCLIVLHYWLVKYASSHYTSSRISFV